MASRELSILVTAKNLASKALGQVKSDVNSLESAAKRAGSNIGRNVGLGVAAAGAAIAVNVKSGVDSLVELERVNNLTAAALESTGNVAKQSVEGIRARAEEMERMTGVDDKVVQNAQNLLLTFTKVREDAFEPTLQAAIDMNAAMGGGDEGLQGVLIQVGKALNDPIKGVTALGRAGVQFTQAQKDQIKEMVEANDLMGAQGIVLEELQTQFGGAAEAANKGVGGSQKRFADAIEDMQMALAKGFLPLIERASDAMGRLVSDPSFMAGVEAFGETLAGGFDAALDFAESVDWGAVGNALSTAGSGAKMAMDAFLGAPPWLQTAVLTGWGLNKLTGGALGSIVGALGSGLIKGVLGMNAGVVNINAATVNGGPGGAGGKGGPGALLGPAAIAAAALAAVTIAGEQVFKGANPVGHSFNQLAGQTGVSRVKVEGDLLTISSETGRSVTSLQSEMIPLLQSGNMTWDQIVEQVRSGRDATVAAQDRSTAAMRDAIPWHQRNIAEIQNFNQSEGTRFAHLGALSIAEKDAIHTLNASEGSRAATQHGLLSSINAKNFSPTVAVNVTPVTNISVNTWTQVANSNQQSYFTTGGIN